MSGPPTAASRRWVRLCKLVLRAVLTAVLVAVAVQGFQNVSQNIGSLDTVAQIAMTLAQAGYAALALAAAAAAWLMPGRAFGIVAWACVLCVVSVGLIPLAWAPEILDDWPLFTGVGVAVSLPVVLGLRWATR